MSFDILQHRDSLTIAKETRTQLVCECPACNGTNLKIDLKTGKWQCWDYPDDEPHKKEIRDLISPPTKSGGDRKLFGLIPLPRKPSRWAMPQGKPVRPKQSRSWEYYDRQGKPLIRTRREDDGKGNGSKSRRIWQEYWYYGAWVKPERLTDEEKKDYQRRVALYRWDRAQKAIERGELVFWVEGEPCVNALEALGLVATTAIGGSSGYTGYGDYSQDFGTGEGVVIVPDRDQVGVKHADLIAADHPQAQWLYPWPDTDWTTIPKDAGLDIADWIAAGATKEQIIGLIESRRDLVFTKSTKPAPKPEPEPVLSPEQLREAIDRLVERSILDTEIEIPVLAAASGRSEQSVRRLVEARIAELAERQRLADDSLELKRLIEQSSKQFDPTGILPDAIARAMLTKSTSDRVDPIRLLQNLLPACGVLLGGRVAVVVKQGESEHDSWLEAPIFWTMDVSSPSSGKSAAQDAIFAPLEAMQSSEDDRVERAEAELAMIREQWEAMGKEERAQNANSTANPKIFEQEVLGTRRTFLLNEGEMEAMMRRLADNPHESGACWVKDELSGLFAGLDQYKGQGKGNSKQLLLTAWNKPLKIRKEYSDGKKSLRLKGQTLNIAGGIQPKLAEKHFAQFDDPDGLLSRILPARPALPANFATWSDVTVSIYGTIDALYRQLKRVPHGLVHFSPEADTIKRQQWERYRRGYQRYEVANPAFAFFLGKMCSYFPRLALWLHCVEWACESGDIRPWSERISAATAARAVQLADFYIGQFLLVQAHAEPEDQQAQTLTGELFRIYDAARKRGGQLSAREATQTVLRRQAMKGLKKPQVLERFEAIAAAIPGCKVENDALIISVSSEAINAINGIAEPPTPQAIDPVDRRSTNDQQRSTPINTDQQPVAVAASEDPKASRRKRY
jgi:hypothetical protein